MKFGVSVTLVALSVVLGGAIIGTVASGEMSPTTTLVEQYGPEALLLVMLWRKLGDLENEVNRVAKATEKNTNFRERETNE
jgi:hypothetical protein